ncbi:MAG: hypothetical protein CM15mP120_02160 [Pseudomonadota bacterium]|nr:MAG: hypothetical protein CM15mP120_02160 [Pseudomonadota bacterium]
MAISHAPNIPVDSIGSPGALAFWDNRATWHFAVNDYHGERRLMHRITVEGEALTAAL